MEAPNNLHPKLEKIDERLTSIEHTLLRNTISLEEHMRRSALAEEGIKTLAAELKPIQLHVANLKFVGSLALWALGSSGFVMVVLKLLIHV